MLLSGLNIAKLAPRFRLPATMSHGFAVAVDRFYLFTNVESPDLQRRPQHGAQCAKTDIISIHHMTPSQNPRLGRERALLQ